MNKKYLALSLVTAIAVAGMSFATISFAQVVTPLVCSTGTSSVGVNQIETLTATGGSGAYFWSGQNLNVTNSSGNQFAVSYPTAGNYLVTVSSGGETSNCTVSVMAIASAGDLVCSPAVQNVTLGQTAYFTAAGGNGNYTWSSPDISILNPNGSGFSASYASTGMKTLTVMSSNLVTSCAVNVLASVTTPGFPNTGGGYGQ